MEHVATQTLVSLPHWVSMVLALLVLGGVSGAWLLYRILSGRVTALELRLDRFIEADGARRDKAGEELKVMLEQMRAGCRAQIASCAQEFISREAALAAIERTRDDVAHRYELIVGKLDHLVEMWNLWAKKNGLKEGA